MRKGLRTSHWVLFGQSQVHGRHLQAAGLRRRVDGQTLPKENAQNSPKAKLRPWQRSVSFIFVIWNKPRPPVIENRVIPLWIKQIRAADPLQSIAPNHNNQGSVQANRGRVLLQAHLNQDPSVQCYCLQLPISHDFCRCCLHRLSSVDCHHTETLQKGICPCRARLNYGRLIVS